MQKPNQTKQKNRIKKQILLGGSSVLTGLGNSALDVLESDL